MTPRQEIARRDDAELREHLAAVVADLVGAPDTACAVGVVARDRSAVWFVQGRANVELDVPAGPDTVFHTASVSKQFTARVIRLLCTDGLLDLDTPVVRHLPWFPFSMVTVRHLLAHTSGLREQWDLLLLSGRSMEDALTTEDVVALVRAQRELNFAPGTEYLYSNTGYTLLALVAEAVTGIRFAQLCRERMFEPLGMPSTFVQDDHHLLRPGRADSYAPVGDQLLRVAMSLSTVGATCVSSTVDDLCRWARHLLDLPVDELGLDAEGYGPGLMTGIVGGHRTVQHSGADAGFRAHVEVLPDEGVAAVVLANGAGCPVRPVALAALGVHSDLVPHPQATAPGTWDAHAGTYLDPVAGTTCVLARAGAELVLSTFSGPVPVVEVRPGVLGARSGSGIEVERHGPSLLLRTPVTDPHELVRLPGDPAAAPPLPGRFASAELGMSVEVDDAGQVTGRAWGPVPLVPVAPGRFVLAWPVGPVTLRIDVEVVEQGATLLLSTGRVRRLRLERA